MAVARDIHQRDSQAGGGEDLLLAIFSFLEGVSAVDTTVNLGQIVDSDVIIYRIWFKGDTSTDTVAFVAGWNPYRRPTNSPVFLLAGSARCVQILHNL